MLLSPAGTKSLTWLVSASGIGLTILLSASYFFNFKVVGVVPVISIKLAYLGRVTNPFLLYIHYPSPNSVSIYFLDNSLVSPSPR